MISVETIENLPDERAFEALECIVVRGFPTNDNSALLHYAARLGAISRDGITSDSNQLEDLAVHLVRDREAPARDPYNNIMISTTHREFPLHTDEYFSAVPARFVLLLCVVPSAAGGTSLVSCADEIVGLLSKDAQHLLTQTVFPSQAGLKSVLSRSKVGWEIQFNEIEMARALQAAGDVWNPAPDISSALAEFRACADRCVQRFDLRPGDCLLLNNRRVLHGRSGFPGGDQRLLKRVRIK